MAKSRKKRQPDVYRYLTRINVIIGIITAILAALIPISWLDRGAWINGTPVIFIVLIPAVLYFSWTLWQDGKQRVTITKDSVRWEKGRWIFQKDVEIPFAEIKEFKDSTTIFSISRKYTIVSNDAEPKQIRLSSAIGNYREMVGRILGRLPKGVANDRTKKSLRRARIGAA